MIPLAVLVVATLPGTTSASFAPVSPLGEIPRQMAPDPILMEIEERHLLPPFTFNDTIRSGASAALAATLSAEIEAAGGDEVGDGPPASVFAGSQVISIYGYPGICVMGELGCHEPEGAIASLREIMADYERLNEEMATGRQVQGALHLIVDVAQPRPQPDGSYLARMALDQIAEYVDLARAHDLLLFLDLQIGWTNPMSGVRRIEEFLVEPFVHLALDAEFATERYGRPPGSVIGTMDAAQVNEVQHYLASLAGEHNLPPKILVLHKFTPRMLIETDQYEDLPEVELTITMDGFGAPPEKIGGYERYALADYSQRAGFKLFFHWDKPLMSPRDVMEMTQAPDYVIYQ